MALDNGTPAEQGESVELAREPEVPEHAPIEPVELGEICTAVRTRQMTPFGNMHVQITVDPRTEQELEVFAQLGKGGDLANSDLEAICRMVSLWLRAGGALQHVIRQLRGIGSSLQVSTKEGKIMSLGDGLARALQKYERAKSRFGLKSLLLGEFDPVELDREVIALMRQPGGGNGRGGNGNGRRHHQVRHGGNEHPLAAKPAASGRPSQPEQYKVVCPECQAPLVFAEGCRKCDACGYSACS